MNEQATDLGWAVVEIMGRVRIAGKVHSETLFGSTLIRVDVPAVDGHPGFTRFYHPQALYSVCPTDEATARAVASHERHPPIERWQLPVTEQPAAIRGRPQFDPPEDYDPDVDEDSEF